MAFSGIMCAFSASLLIVGSFLPFALFIVPVVSGIILMSIAYEYSKKYAYIAYAVVSTLSLIFTADKEFSIFFIALAGHYPILKFSIEKFKNKYLRAVLKIAVFTASMVFSYFIITIIFPVLPIREEFLSIAQNLQFALVAFLILTFLIYDKALEKIFQIYILKTRQFRDGS